MGNHDHLPLFAATRSPVPGTSAFPLNIVGILREAMKLPSRTNNINGKYFTLQVMLTIVTPFSLLVLLHYMIAGPLIMKVEDGYDTNSLDRKDLTHLILVELFFLLPFFAVSFFGMVLTIYASASIYVGKHVALADLLLSIRFAWKRPLITWLHVSFLSLVYVVLFMVVMQLVNLVIPVNDIANYSLSCLLGILGVLCFLYMLSKWTLALVISVVENIDEGHDTSSGSQDAISRAGMLMRGRELHAFFLMVILAMLSAPIYVFFYVAATDDDDELGPLAQFAFGSVATALSCFAKFFVFVVFTVLYCECKQSHGEKVDAVLGPEYSPASPEA